MNIKEASYLLKANYNIEGILTELPGEVDLNYKVETSYNNYVFKISKGIDQVEFLDFQNEILFYLNGNKSPKVINDINGNSIFRFSWPFFRQFLILFHRKIRNFFDYAMD